MSRSSTEKYLGVKVYKNGRRVFSDVHLLRFRDKVDKQALNVFISYDNKQVIVNKKGWMSDYWRVVIEGTETGNNFIGISR